MKVWWILLAGALAGCGQTVPARTSMQLQLQPQPAPVIIFSRKPATNTKIHHATAAAERSVDEWKAYALRLERLSKLCAGPRPPSLPHDTH